MAPKTGSKKLVEIWRPERDLDCRTGKGIWVEADRERDFPFRFKKKNTLKGYSCALPRVLQGTVPEVVHLNNNQIERAVRDLQAPQMPTNLLHHDP